MITTKIKMVVVVQEIMVIIHGGMDHVGQEIILLEVVVIKMDHIGQVQLAIITIMVPLFYHLQILKFKNMKITIKKISEDKLERQITDGENIIFHDQLIYVYMNETVVDKQKTLDMINQLSGLFGEFTEIENDFDI